MFSAPSDSQSVVTRWLQRTSAPIFSSYCIVAAFTTYFCMYAFRKPFTAGTFEDVILWGIGYKTILVAAQVAGYTISKFLGIRVISEMPPSRRALSILGLIGWAEVALLLFAVVPPPLNFVMLFLNGLPLGMVFGLVLAYLEGRQLTEALSAGLCASFIMSSGCVKSVGRYLVVAGGISEYWMPCLTGLLFVVPLLLGVWMLSQIPPPTRVDVEHRSARAPMDRDQRGQFLRRHWLGLTALVLTYMLLTVMRSIRDDFAVEIWRDLGHPGKPEIFAQSETLVMFGVVIVNGAAIWIRCNRRAFLGALGLIAGGFVLVLAAVLGQQAGALSAFPFMVLAGLGMYVPYVAFHTTVFERLIAAFRERGNIGYLMYLADAFGYLGYIAVMVIRNVTTDQVSFLNLFLRSSLWISLVAVLLTLSMTVYYAQDPAGVDASFGHRTGLNKTHEAGRLARPPPPRGGRIEVPMHILITGTSRGLGRALAAGFAAAGHQVTGCARTTDAVEQLQAELGPPHDFTALDISHYEQVVSWIEQVLARSGPPDLLINNAAVINRNARLWEVPVAEFGQLVDINLKGMFHVLHALLPAMVKRRQGVIINLSSGWGRSPASKVAPYCASKWAVEGLTQSLARELPETMAAIPMNPGIIDTEMLRSCLGGGAQGFPDAQAWAERAVPYFLQLSASDNGRPLSVPAM